MTERQAIEAIYQQWTEGWAALHPSNPADPNYVPYGLDDEDYRPGALGALGAWATVVVRHSTREQMTQGAPSNDDCRGSVIVQLFGPRNEGSGKLASLATDVRTALAKKSLGDLDLYAGRSGEGPKNPAWAMRVVVIPFRYTETT